MCRLLGVVSATPITVADAVGDDVLKDFVALTKVHGDGWGVATIGRPGEDPAAEVSAGTALDDPAFVAATHDQPARPPRSCTCVGRPTDSRCSRRTPIPSSPTASPWRTTAPSSRWACSTTSSNPTSPHRCAAPPTASATSRLIRQYRRTAPNLAEAVRRAVAQLRELLSRRQPQRAGARRGPADRRPRARPQPVARRGHRGDHRRGAARRAPRGLLRAAGGPARRRHAGDRVHRFRRPRRGSRCRRSASSPSRCATCR